MSDFLPHLILGAVSLIRRNFIHSMKVYQGIYYRDASNFSITPPPKTLGSPTLISLEEKSPFRILTLPPRTQAESVQAKSVSFFHVKRQ